MTSLTEEECSICLDKLKNEIAHLSCNHFFHYRCIGDWINNNREMNKDVLCPICNQPFEIINIYLPENVNVDNKEPHTIQSSPILNQRVTIGQESKKTCIIL